MATSERERRTCLCGQLASDRGRAARLLGAKCKLCHTKVKYLLGQRSLDACTSAASAADDDEGRSFGGYSSVAQHRGGGSSRIAAPPRRSRSAERCDGMRIDRSQFEGPCLPMLRVDLPPEGTKLGKISPPPTYEAAIDPVPPSYEAAISSANRFPGNNYKYNSVHSASPGPPPPHPSSADHQQQQAAMLVAAAATVPALRCTCLTCRHLQQHEEEMAIAEQLVAEEERENSLNELVLPMETQAIMYEVLSDGMAFCSIV